MIKAEDRAALVQAAAQHEATRIMRTMREACAAVNADELAAAAAVAVLVHEVAILIAERVVDQTAAKSMAVVDGGVS